MAAEKKNRVLLSPHSHQTLLISDHIKFCLHLIRLFITLTPMLQHECFFFFPSFFGVRPMDCDKDGKLNFVEFSDHAYNLFKNNVEHETAGAHVSSAQHKFLELDLNKNKYTQPHYIDIIMRKSNTPTCGFW